MADAVSYSFPRIKRIQLHSFSLFRLRPDVAVPFSGGVLCLAGANGIGKSTFLSTVNYGLTGAVPHPRRRLLSIPSYIKEATEFSNSFFEGRIDEQDRDAAAVTVEFSIKEKLYSITRGLFDPADVRYAQAEERFVPRFRQLTNLFLGIDLDVSFAVVPPTGVKLTVEMRGDVRHDQTQMSESQRFFVDIALRMALAQQISSPEGLATLFIDTPEGSLDIAYEDRAGEMFAEFVESGHDLIVTANINSSKLLQTLAQRCGTKRMTLNQMTGWTELSDVQQKATTLFHKAYEDILTALQTGPT